jgi:hypothetical protein
MAGNATGSKAPWTKVVNASVLVGAMCGIIGCASVGRGPAAKTASRPESSAPATTPAAPPSATEHAQSALRPEAPWRTASTQPVDPRVVDAFGGSRITDVITGADSVEAFRLDGGFGAAAPAEGAAKVDGQPVIAGPVPVTGEARQALVWSLTNPDFFLFHAASGCTPHWDVAYRFHKGEHFIDLVICLHCRIIETFFDGKSSGWVRAGYLSNGPLVVARSVFPKDEALKSIESP